jgi:hypothetical protein
MNIEKILSPTNGKLIIKNETATAEILDAELDSFSCTFNNDLCVQIDTEDMGYITLSLSNLQNLKKLILQAEKYYNENL